MERYKVFESRNFILFYLYMHWLFAGFLSMYWLFASFLNMHWLFASFLNMYWLFAGFLNMYWLLDGFFLMKFFHIYSRYLYKYICMRVLEKNNAYIFVTNTF
jgi:hypothetical protein